MSVATETVLAAEQTGEYAPIRLNHLAYVTHDTAATVRFWTEVMQMPLVEAVMHERVPSTGDPFPYVHFFFRMQDGSTIAFFEAVGLPDRPEPVRLDFFVVLFAALQRASKRQTQEAITHMAGTILATMYLGGLSWFLIAIRVKSSGHYVGSTAVVVMILLMC